MNTALSATIAASRAALSPAATRPLKLLLGCVLSGFVAQGALEPQVLTGRAAMGDWTTDAPGVRRRITVADLPPPDPEQSAVNRPRLVRRPEGAWPQVPEGFKVEEFAADLDNPRVVVTAPNGDVFVAESRPGRVRVLRDANRDGKPELSEIFADDLNRPFGIAFHPPGPEPRFIYVANTGSVVRWPYRNGETRAAGRPEKLIELPGGGQLTGGGHWTRDIVFSADGARLFVSIGSKSNADDDEEEKDRARIMVYDSDGRNGSVFATGIRNAVGLAIHPATGEVWASVNERDEIGDDLVPDYVTRVKEGGFYGWPWFYLGAHQDPRHKGKHPELRDTVLVPDVLIQSHSASLDMAFYDGLQFPVEYRDNAFAAQHGSWNRTRRTGYKVIRVPTKDGRATGEYIDFMTGFVTPEGDVWGRPVGVAVSREGSLLVSDDGGNRIWRVHYVGGSDARTGGAQGAGADAGDRPE
jgi:glucose/arabinose dehydrogenase